MAAIEFRSRGSAAVSGRAERGFSLIEVLTSIMVTAVGVLGVAALQGLGIWCNLKHISGRRRWS